MNFGGDTHSRIELPVLFGVAVMVFGIYAAISAVTGSHSVLGAIAVYVALRRCFGHSGGSHRRRHHRH